MGLPNRVAPDGTLHDDPARGLFTGNRGVIHDPQTRALNGKRWTLRAWICCALVWKDTHRKVWGANHKRKDGTMGAGWSELFVADEITALAAGHRPCFHCRREDALRFRSAFATGPDRVSAVEMNNQLHAERWLSASTLPQRLSPIDLPGLPDGTMIKGGGQFYAMRERRALPWSFSGYDKPAGLSDLARLPLTLVTPKCVVHALRAGYKAVWHPTATASQA